MVKPPWHNSRLGVDIRDLVSNPLGDGRLKVALFGDLKDRRELEKKAKADGRLPPGQSLTLKWPVLHYGSVPRFDAAKWDFKISGMVEEPIRLTWEEFRALQQTEVTSDFHCVTRWSRLDNRWKGMLFTNVMMLVKANPEALFALVLAEEGYTANVPLPDLQRSNVLFASEHDGEPLAAEHGGPVRLVVPHLYAWKSVKGVRGFMLLDHDRLGFWERNGYHAYGDIRGKSSAIREARGFEVPTKGTGAGKRELGA
ncbi:MAG: Sulfite oxidase-like oxidoreductase [Candidatus Acidoferrum typicum]|nr:Sulfite oxidase-like oxidoreductase [Candidatus Acidoferrum typicum]